MTEGDIMIGVVVVVCMVIYYLVKEKIFSGITKWLLSVGLFIAGVSTQFFLHRRWDRFSFWGLTGMLVYYLVFEGIKWYTLKRSGTWLAPGEKNTISEEEEEDINKITFLLVCIWMAVGFFLIR